MFISSCQLTWADFHKIQINSCKKFLNDYFQDERPKETCPPDYTYLLCWPETLSGHNASFKCPLRAENNNVGSDVINRLCSTNIAVAHNLTFYSWANLYSYCSIVAPRIGNVLYDFTLIDPDYQFHPSQRIRRWKDYEWLYTMEQCEYLASIFCLIVAVFIFWKYSRLQNVTVKMLINLFIAMLLQFSISFTTNWIYNCKIFYGSVLYDDDYWDSIACKALITFKNYFELTKFTWLLVKGWFFYNSITKVFVKDSGSMKKHLIIGWGLPIIPIVPWIAYHIISSTDFCWVNSDLKFDILGIPVLVIVVINICFFILNLRIVISKINSSHYLQRKKYFIKWVTSSLMLIFLFGTHDILYALWPWIGNKNKKFYLLIIVQLINPTQGCVVAVLYCFINTKVRKEVQRSWKNNIALLEIDVKILKRKFWNIGKMKKKSSDLKSALPAPQFTAHI